MKQYHRYQMNFDGKAARFSGICMGLSVFLLAVYYLFVRDLSEVGVGTLVFCLWLPLILNVAYIVLLRLIRLNAPGVYAIAGGFYCLLLIIGLFFSGGALRIFLGLLAYVLCGGVLILTAGGYLPGRLTAAVCFAVVLAVRLLCFDLGKVGGWEWLPELSSLSMISGLMFLPIVFKEGKMKELT